MIISPSGKGARISSATAVPATSPPPSWPNSKPKISGKMVAAMPLTLTINGISTAAPPGPSLFDYAQQLGIKVPTSCQKQGKCKECLMEIVQGMQFLSDPVDEEKHLKPPFRLSCRARV